MKFIDVPGHPFNVGVTIMFPVTLEPVLFDGAVHDAILPVPLTDSPMLAFELVHVKVAPVGLLTKLPILIAVPGHTAILLIWDIVGVG